MSRPTKENWIAVNRVFKYLCGITSYGLCDQTRLGLNGVFVLDMKFWKKYWEKNLSLRKLCRGRKVMCI
jgi:hypothetical protein